jgi:hypothetical protein
MAKPTRTNTRSPAAKGLDRTALSDAKFNTADKVNKRIPKAKFPASETMLRNRLDREGTKLLKEQARIKKAGARMGRAQAMAKAKQKGK